MKQFTKRYYLSWLLMLPFLLNACIGEDVKPDSIQSIAITSEKNAMLITESMKFTATLKNPFGDSFSGDVTWQSSAPEVAPVNSAGIVAAVSAGQTKITATHDGITSNEILITVVEDVSSVASITVSSPGTDEVGVGSTLQLTASAKRLDGTELTITDFSWTSSNTEIATVSQVGLVTGVANGVVTITASANGVESQAYELTIGDGGAAAAGRTGNFTGNRSYTVSGVATLSSTENGVKLTLADNFSTSSGPGLYLYLSNSSGSVSGGVELGKLRKNSGSDEYTIDGVTLDQYNFVVVYCKPFGLPFGSAQFN